MAALLIKFSVTDAELGYFNSIFYEFYGRYSTQIFPIYILSDETDLADDGLKEERVTFNYRVVELSEDPDKGDREIAKIFLNRFPRDYFVVVFEGDQEGKKSWYKVEKMVESILDHLWGMGAKIMSVEPNGLLVDITKYQSKKEREEMDNLSFESPPVTGIPGMEKEVNQSNLGGSGSSNPKINLSKKLKSKLPDLSLIIDGDPSGNKKKYGTDGDITANQIRTWIKQCKSYQENEGSIKRYYDEVLIEYHKKFTFETFRSWMKDPRFKPR